MPGELLFSGGLAIVGAAVIGGAVSAAALWVSRKRLDEKLNAEYGKKRR